MPKRELTSTNPSLRGLPSPRRLSGPLGPIGHFRMPNLLDEPSKDVEVTGSVDFSGIKVIEKASPKSPTSPSHSAESANALRRVRRGNLDPLGSKLRLLMRDLANFKAGKETTNSEKDLPTSQELTPYEKAQIEAVTALVRETNAEVQEFLKT